MNPPSWDRSRLLLVLAGLALLAIFVAHAGVHAISREVSRLRPSAIWILVPYAVGTAIGGLPWALLLPQALRPSLSATIVSRFVASGANALLPFLGLAGEPSRLLWLRGDAVVDGVAAIALDRLLYNSAGAVLLFTAALVSLSTRLPLSLSAAAAALAVAIALVTLVGFWLVARGNVGHRLSGVLRKVVRECPAKRGCGWERALGARLDESLVRLLRERRPLGWGLLLHLLARAVMATEVYVALKSLQTPFTPAESLVLATAPIASSLFASSIPSQLGVQEGVFMLTSGALGLSPALGLTLGLLMRIRQLVFVSLTPVLLALAKR